MLFNSIDFAIFLPVVFLLYWFVNRGELKWQNLLLLVSSYFFYACWDWRFMFLLIFSTFLDYYTGIKIDEAATQQGRRKWLWLSVIINLGFLGLFKYYNFFIDSFADALSLIGLEVHFSTLQVVIPVGISFYTFHGLSYVIDIYYRRIHAERSFVSYAVFVSFFPLLVAGPIERATHLLPQILKKRTFNYAQAIDGLRQILWGLFKKIVIADNCASFANDIFNHSEIYSGSTLALGALFFTFQIYGDFSGYSDIALGTARLFGIELLRNFAYPYFSRDMAEFWRRWHISLSSWFKDYLYIPLGGSRVSKSVQIRNTFIIFLVSGFWHGANWTFIVWGFLNALFIMPSVFRNANRNYLDIVAQGKIFPTAKEFFSMLITFVLTVLAWIFFRANNLAHAVSILSEICSSTLLQAPHFAGMERVWMLTCLLLFFLLVEWKGREQQFALAKLGLNWNPFVRRVFYYFLILMIILFKGADQQFIYFQF